MNLLGYLYRQSRFLLVLASVMGVIGGIAGAALVAVINAALAGGHEVGKVPVAIAFFGLCVLSVLCKTASEIALLRLTQAAIFKLRVQISHKLLGTPHLRLQELGKHGLLVILTKDIDIFVQAFQFLPTAFGNLVVVMACFGYMAWISWRMCLAFLISMVVATILYQLAERGPLKHLAQVRSRMDALYQHFRDLVEGSKELQLNAERGRRFVDEVITGGAKEYQHTFERGMGGYTMVANAGTMVFYVLVGVVILVLPALLPQSASNLTAITLVLLFVMRPIVEIMNALPLVRQAAISLEKIEQLNGQLTRDTDQMTQARLNISAQPEIEMRDVVHHYPSANDDRQFMLGPINLRITAGELIYIVGGNGCGKTTLAMLLLGFYTPEQGQILVDGQAVEPEHQQQFRQIFSAVFADFHLFEQLLTTRDQDESERAHHYLQRLHMQHKVTIQDGGFSTLKLSTGQRKRLALVGAYLEDRPVYVFDEWAADQDPSFKRVFYTELLPELKARGKTVIVITHDDAYFDLADRVIKVADGQIVSDLRPATKTSQQGIARIA